MGFLDQFGMATETDYGTVVTPSRFLEINTESLAAEKGLLSSIGSGRGRYARTDRRKHYIKGAAGPTEFDVMNKGFGLLFKHILGSAAVAQVGSTAEYTHTFTPDAVGLRGMFATLQKGKENTEDGTVEPFTYPGAKVTEWEFALDTDGVLKLTVTWAAKTESTATALATASYASAADVWGFNEAVLLVGGTAVVVKSLTIHGSNALDLERRGINAVQRREPLSNGEWVIDGKLDGEFENMDAYDAYIAGDQSTLLLTFTGDTIPTASNPFKLIFDIPAIEYQGSTPTGGGMELNRQDQSWVALKDASNPIITITQHTNETTV